MSDQTNPFQNRNELKDHFEIEKLRAELSAEREAHAETRALIPSKHDTGAAPRPLENADWWSVAVLERRARRKAEAQLASERERAQMYLDCNVAYAQQVDKLRDSLNDCVKQLEAYDKDVPESARSVLKETQK
jgi:hypothetical protein